MGSLVFTAGLLVRHRAEWWASRAGYVLGITFVIWLFSLVTRIGEGSALAGMVATVTFYLVLLGVLVAGALPRSATALLLLASIIDTAGFPLPEGVEALVGLVGLVGLVRLAYAMWDERPGAYGPVRLWEGSVVEPAPRG